MPLIELSELDGLRLSFGEPLRFLVSPVTDRVHPRYQICGAPTGRSSTSKPNIQGAPRDPRIRGVFKAADGYVLVAADYNCMELRGAAYFFDDPQLAAVFERGDDPHQVDREPCRWPARGNHNRRRAQQGQERQFRHDLRHRPRQPGRADLEELPPRHQHEPTPKICLPASPASIP